ncbi:MAG: alpha/beta-hydrolase family protein [Balneolales bacterium]|nr:alpha/beta-hydrolase family protein [Balneolales bacterium]
MLNFIREIRPFSTTGLIAGTFFFALSMTPGLVPRTDVFQGIVTGLSFAAGYGIGVLTIWLWMYLGLPRMSAKIKIYSQIVSASVCIFIGILFLREANGWQNELRALMDMEPAPGMQPLTVALVAILVFLAIMALTRLFRFISRIIIGRLKRYVPPKISYLAGLVVSFVLFWSLLDGVLFSLLLRAADSAYEQIDELIEPEAEQPANPMLTGSSASLLSWEKMGRQGRRFLSARPSSHEIAAFTELKTMDPIRVYVGMGVAESPEEKAALALEELIRVGAFNRNLLIIATPTGTGWIDPASILPLEYLHRGDVATVSAQYSYLPSALSLLVEEEYGVEMARALFREIYDYWSGLAVDKRPKLYLHGLSLGALNSDRSFDLYDIVNDPINGAFWVGPPFRKQSWQTITANRVPGSPAWLPRFRDGSVVRFANQQGGLEFGDAPWGNYRMAYLQYASDPVTFFDPRSFFRRPEWMNTPRGPDVSPGLSWYPVVTMVQLALDMASGTAPRGFGHEYAAVHYFDSWLALTEPSGWTSEELHKLRDHFSEIDLYGP